MKKVNLAIITMILLLIIPIISALTLTTTPTRDSIGTYDVRVNFISQDPNPVAPGQYVDLKWRVENYGSGNLQNVQFELITKYPFSLDNEDDRIRDLGTLTARQIGDDAAILYWRVRVDEAAVETDDNEIELKYYVDGQEKVKLEPFDIVVEEEQPLLSIESVATEDSHNKPGELIKTNIVLRSMTGSYLRNIKINLNLEDTDFVTIGSTTEKAIRILEPQKQETVAFTLASTPTTESKVHNIPLTVSYLDENGDNHTITSSFGLKIYDPPDYLLNLEETDIYTANKKGKIIVSMSNIGKADLNFVTVELLETDDYNILSPGSVYLGNLESDDFETAEFDIFVKSDKKNVPFKLRVTLKDSYNQNLEEIKTISLKLYTKEEAIKYGLEKPANYTGIIIVGVIILLIIFLIVRRQIKRKKSLQRKK